MINKLYDKFKKFISENLVFFLIVSITYVICTIPFPYYINAPGGVIDISDRVDFKEKKETKGSFNLAYVKEYKATIPMLIFSYFQPHWDILSKEEVLYDNETIKEANFRNHILLMEANQNAIVVALKEANREVKIKNRDLYVTYIDPDANTDLQIQDRIVAVNGEKVTSKLELVDRLQNYHEHDTVNFDILRDGKKAKATATLYEKEKRSLIGIVISEIKHVDHEGISIHFKQEESGPSGGFMMTLAIYNALVKEDLSHGLKIVGTGTIDENGMVGSIGGVEYKLEGAINEKADLFFVPAGENYEEAIKVKKEHQSDIEIVKIEKFQDALDYLHKIS